jgi:glucose-1-phosphate cytidylyltransferase
VTGFVEKSRGDGGWINGGFFVLSPKCIDFIDSDNSAWEQKPLKDIALKGELMAYEHKDF